MKNKCDLYTIEGIKCNNQAVIAKKVFLDSEINKLISAKLYFCAKCRGLNYD